MLLDKFDFDLPKELIAHSPVFPRDHARMLVYKRADESVELGHFFDLPNYLKEGDVVVFNNSKVVPARLCFQVEGKEFEIFLLEEVDGFWKSLIRPGKAFLTGKVVKFKEASFEVKKIDEDGFRYLECNLGGQDLSDFLEKWGQMPVPPYIHGSDYNQEDYNTVYSNKKGSVAAPTAGLHFTDELLSRLKAKGIQIEFVTLHVGLGTFLPVKVKDSRFHKMHMEKYAIDYQTAKRLNKYKAEGRRIVAVGTTSVRVLEDNFGRFREIRAGRFSTDIFIKPGYKFGFVDALITNFHLPKSTLLMLVASLVGRERVLDLYRLAVIREMRFYSFGDGMLII